MLHVSSRNLIAVAFIAVILGAAGCSSDPQGSSNPDGNNNPGSNQTTLPECPTAAAMKSGLGITFSEPTVAGNGTKQRNCGYASTDGSGIASVQFQIITNAADFAATKAGFNVGGRTTADVSGLGDQAFSSVLAAGGIDTNTTAAIKGSLQVFVTSRASLDQEKAFVATLLG